MLGLMLTYQRGKATENSLPIPQADVPQIDAQAKYCMVPKEDAIIFLPITFENIRSPATVLAIPDTGADVNVICSDLAQELGFDIRVVANMDLQLPNGKSVRSYGVATASWRFAKSAADCSQMLECTFRVVRKVASPLILCRDFLKQTQTMTLHRDRLLKRACPNMQFPSVRALGDVQERFHCSLDGENVQALADSGSDVDLISLKYATKRGFRVEPGKSWLMFADRSVVRTRGTFRAQLTAGFDGIRLPSALPLPTVAASNTQPTDDRNSSSGCLVSPSVEVEASRKVIETDFHVLEDLRLDAIIGMASLEALAVYTHEPECLVAEESWDEESTELNRIMLIPSLKKRYEEIAQAWRARNREPRLPNR